MTDFEKLKELAKKHDGNTTTAPATSFDRLKHLAEKHDGSTTTAPATSSTLAKSNTDLQLEGLKANAIAQSDGNVWDEETLRLNRLQNERAKLLSYMTNAQKNQYNAKEQNARDAYIDSIRNDLNKKQGEDYAKEILNEKDKGNQFAKTTALGLSSGVRSFGSGMKGAINAVIGDEKETVTRGAAQHAFNAIRPELEGTQMVAADLANMVGNMAPSVLASVIGAPVGLGFLGTVGMGLSSGGNAYDEAIEQGYDRNKARLYGAASGIKEVALQKILGSLPGINKTGGVVKKLVGGMSDDVLAKIISSPNVRQAFIDAVASGFSESLEETTQDIIDIPLRNVIFGEKNKIDPKELGYTALLSFLTGEAFNAPGTFKTLSNKNNGIETTQPVPETVENTVDAVQNDVDAVQNDVDAAQNDEEMPVEVVEETTVAETEPVAESEEEVVESKPITDAVKRTVKAVNPNAENSQQIYRQIMVNNGYGKLVKIMDKIAKRFGTEVQYYADDTGSEGYNFNNKIYLNINNMRDSADAIWKLFKHELTHSLEGTDAYGKLLKSRAGAELFNKFLIDKGYTVTDEKGNVSASIDALANEITELYRRNGVELDPQGLNHEMVARFIEESDLFTNEESIRRLAQESPDFVHRILRWIKDTIANIGADADTRNLRNAERMFERALDQAVKGEYKNINTGKQFSFSTDSNGRQLTPEQQEYFKDSKVRDEEGRLLVMYQGNAGGFTVFDRKKSKSSNLYGRGFYFTKDESHATQYGKANPYYLNIKNPLSPNQHNITKQQLKNFLKEVEANEDDYGLDNYGYGATVESVLNDIYGKGDFEAIQDVSVTAIGDMVEAVELFNKVNGTDYDGITLPTETVVFNSNQIKNIDNAKPTNNPDIRYSFKDDGKLNAKSKDYVYKDIVDSFKEITGASRLKGSPEIREAINAYAEGSVDAGVNKDVLGSIFDKMWQAADKTVPMSYDNAKNEFFNKIENYEKDIKDVTRYNNAREAKAALKAERSDTVEKILTDKKFSKTFFKDYTAARRAYDKLTRKVMLTPDDTNIMRQLSEGTISWDEVERRSDEFNVDAIKKVYDAYNTKHKFESIEKELKAKVTGEYRSEAEDLIENSDAWEDKPMGAMYSRETMERNIEDITKKGNNKNRRNEDAYWINKTYFKPVHENEAKSTRLKNELGAKVKALQLGTKPMYTVMIRNEYTGMPVQTEVSESGLVQLYGEGLINDNTLERLGADKEKIHKAVNEFRGIYNQLIEMANETLIRNGYRPVEYRKDYFPHFTENKPDSTLGKVAAYFGIEMRADELPTDIAGITHTFRPGKKWVGNFLERKTKVTDYDALKGFDRYINGAADVIFHTDDIQRLRALESALRYKYSDEGTKKRIKEIEDSTTLTPEEKKSLIEDIMKANETSHLPNLVTEIRNYTDNLAGKKSISDRNWEHAMGRGLYNFTKKMENRVSANMVALNPGSWLTNFIPITQVSGIVDPKKLARAIWDTSKGAAKKDKFTDLSDFLVNRKGSEMTFKTTTDKIQDILTKPFEMIDSFTAEIVTRALYYDKMAEVKNEAEALEYANDMAARVMADRSKGAKPTAFNAQNPVAKLFTMFQVEVNNQYSYMFKDVPADLRKKGLSSLAWAFVKMFLGAYLYNEVYEKYIGRRAAFDPVDIAASAIDDFTNPDVKKSKAVANAAKDVVDELPFVSGILGGGRVPISSALPSVSKLNEAGVGLISGEMNSKKAAQQLGKELIKPAAYLVPPVGGGQIKKAIEGISTVAKGGEVTYDNEGNEILKYPIEDKSALKYLQAGLFGKSSLKESQDYYNNGMPTLTVKQTQNYHKAVEAGINYKQYMAALQASKGAESDKDKDGKTIALSLAKNKKAAIDEAVKEFNLSKKQKELLYEANDVSEKVW